MSSFVRASTRAVSAAAKAHEEWTTTVDCYLKSSFSFGKGRQSDSFGLRHWLICSWLGQDSEARW